MTEIINQLKFYFDIDGLIEANVRSNLDDIPDILLPDGFDSWVTVMMMYGLHYMELPYRYVLNVILRYDQEIIQNMVDIMTSNYQICRVFAEALDSYNHGHWDL